MGEEEAQFSTATDTGKRKLDEIQLAKQKAQEIVARLVNDAEAKRPRLDDSSEPPSDDAFSQPPFPGLPEKPSAQLTESSQLGSIPFTAQPYPGVQGSSKRIDIPNGKVGVIIGKGGETIKYLQLQSGAKIQVTKDTEADPYSQTRDVELVGTAEQISRAEQLIKDVIAETDVGGSVPSSTRVFNSVQPGAEQVTLRVPNNKVALIIGKGGETIKNMQNRSGARIQIIPLHLPPGDTSTERNIYIGGTKEQMETAKELINEIVENRVRNSSMANSYMQQGYRPPGNWGPPPLQQPGYGYSQSESYSTAPPPYYGSYPPQTANWDQSNQSGAPPPPQQNTEYNYYGQHAQTGSVQTNSNYGYGQEPVAHTYDQDYSQQQQSYGLDSSTQTSQNDQQKSYVTPGYGAPVASPQLDGSTPSQHYGSQSTTPPPSAYPVTYSQPLVGPPVYGISQSYSGAPSTQPAYDQTGYPHSGYGVQQPAQAPLPGQVPPTSQPVYGQTGYPQQPVPPQSNYVGTNSVYGHPQTQGQPQLATHGYSQAYGAERNGDENNVPPVYGSLPASQEAAHSQS